MLSFISHKQQEIASKVFIYKCEEYGSLSRRRINFFIIEGSYTSSILIPIELSFIIDLVYNRQRVHPNIKYYGILLPSQREISLPN